MIIRWLAAMCCLFYLGAAQALILTPREIAPGVYAFIGDTGMRTLRERGHERQQRLRRHR